MVRALQIEEEEELDSMEDSVVDTERCILVKADFSLMEITAFDNYWKTAEIDELRISIRRST